MKKTLAFVALLLAGCAKEVHGPARIGTPTLIEPANGEVMHRDGIWMIWEPVEGAIRYDVEINDERVTAIHTTILWYGSGTVSWRVRGVAQGSVGEWSETRTFVLP
jgi:hypothetical protein